MVWQAADGAANSHFDIISFIKVKHLLIFLTTEIRMLVGLVHLLVKIIVSQDLPSPRIQAEHLLFMEAFNPSQGPPVSKDTPAGIARQALDWTRQDPREPLIPPWKVILTRPVVMKPKKLI